MSVERDVEKEEESKEERLRDLARWIQGRPWNKAGTDKTWVFDAWRAHRELREAFVRPDEEK